MMHRGGKSDSAIVAVKPTNNAEQSAAEPVESRAETEGNAGQQSTRKRVQFGYGINYLVDIENAIIVDVEPTPARTYDEVESTKTMLDRTERRFNLKPKRLAADTAYGTGRFLGWLVSRGIMPHIPVRDASERTDGTFSRNDFRWDRRRGVYICPNNKVHITGKVHEGYMLRYRASKFDCDVCALKMQCCPNMPARQVPRDLHEDARDLARRLMGTKAFLKSRDERKRARAGQAHQGGNHERPHGRLRRHRVRGAGAQRDIGGRERPLRYDRGYRGAAPQSARKGRACRHRVPQQPDHTALGRGRYRALTEPALHFVCRPRT
jgi:Transposase DDE domain